MSSWISLGDKLQGKSIHSVSDVPNKGFKFLDMKEQQVLTGWWMLEKGQKREAMEAGENWKVESGAGGGGR